MATKPPKLSFDEHKDKREAVGIWLDQFNDWCVFQGWRDTSKPASDHSYWKMDNYAAEISALRLGMPPAVLRNVKSTVVLTISTDLDDADADKQYSGYPVGMAKFYSFTLFWPRRGLGGRMTFFGHVQTTALRTNALQSLRLAANTWPSM